MNPIPGYNILLKEEHPPKEFSKMSIIEFLRRTREKKELPKKVAIYGLEILLLTNKNLREATRSIRNILRANNKTFREKGYTFLFIPQSELYEDGSVYMKIGNKKADISSLFGLRLQIKEVGLYHADFEF